MKLHSMFIISTAFVLFAFTSLISCSDSVSTDPSDNGNNSTDDIVYHERALDVYDNIVRYFYVDEHNLFMENFPKLPGDLEVSYLWPYFGLVGGVNTLIELGYDSQPFINVVDRLDLYFDDSADHPVYGAYPPELGASTHFYDDNAVTGLELINAYRITGNPV